MSFFSSFATFARGARKSGGGGAPIPMRQFGVNLAPPAYGGRTLMFANYADYSRWAALGQDPLEPVTELSMTGELLVSATDRGAFYMGKAIPTPRAPNTRMKATWTVTSGTGNVSLGAVAVGGNNCEDFEVDGNSATWNVPDPEGVWYHFRTDASLIIDDLQIRECDEEGNWLYPNSGASARWHPVYVAERKALYRGGYVRFMDWMQANDNWFGFHADGFKTEWADRPTVHSTIMPEARRGFVARGSGNASLGFRIRPTVNYPNDTVGWAAVPMLGAIYPNHIFGESSENVTLVINAPSGAGSIDWDATSAPAITITITPPSSATTPDDIITWFQGPLESSPYTGTDAGVVGMIEAYLPEGDGSGTFVATGTQAFSKGDWQFDACGIPLEWIIDFCKLAEVRPWFCPPANATDDYAEEYGSLIAAALPSRLGPDKDELGNEGWNTGFPNTTAARIIGISQSLGDNQNLAIQRQRHIAFMTALATVREAGSFRRVLGTQSNGAGGVTAPHIADTAAMAVTDEGAGAPYIFPDGVAGASTVDEIMALKEGNIAAQTAFSVAQRALWEAAGKTYIVHEAGDHTANYCIEALFLPQHTDPRNKTIFSRYLSEQRRALGSSVAFSWFYDTGPAIYFAPSPWGLELAAGHALEDSPKKQAYVLATQGIFIPYVIPGGAISVDGGRIEGQTLTWTIPQILNAVTVDYEVFDGLDETVLASGTIDPGGSTTVQYVQLETDVGREVELHLTINGTDDFDPVEIETADELETTELIEAWKIDEDDAWISPFNGTVRIHAIGPGGGGPSTHSLQREHAGGGGAYMYVDQAVTIGMQLDIVVPAGASEADTTVTINGGALILRAKAGTNGVEAESGWGLGGTVDDGEGDGGNDGGEGGHATGVFQPNAGGGAAGGPNGAGGPGGSGVGAGGGGGGGGANGGEPGGDADAETPAHGGHGGNNRDGTGGGTGGAPGDPATGGTAGGGGGGVYNTAGGDGSMDPIWFDAETETHYGPSGGAGGGYFGGSLPGGTAGYGGGACANGTPGGGVVRIERTS